MKKLRLASAFLIALVLLAMSFSIVGAQAPEPKIPNPTSEFYSNDFADVISDSTEHDIVSLGESTFKATQGGQVVFVSVDTLNGSPIEEYSIALASKWKIGTKDKGVLFIISTKERESRIEVGYGYEGALTDLDSYKLLNKFSEINQEKGMDEAVKTIYSDICSIVKGEGDSVQYPQGAEERSKSSVEDNFFTEHPILSIIFIIIILVMIILDFVLTGGQVTFFILRMMAASARRGGGGSGGGSRNSGGGGRFGGGGASGRF